MDEDLKKVKRRDIVCLIHFRNVVSHFTLGNQTTNLSNSPHHTRPSVLISLPKMLILRKSRMSLTTWMLFRFSTLKNTLLILRSPQRIFPFQLCPAKRNKIKKNPSQTTEMRSIDSEAFHHGPMQACEEIRGCCFLSCWELVSGFGCWRLWKQWEPD